jgi:carboxyl-terminal processing protease
MRILLLLGCLLPAWAWGQTPYEKDFAAFWQTVNERYAYLKVQQIDWAKVKEIYQPQAARVTSRVGLIELLEAVLHELHNGHSSLGTNLATSNRLIPTELDLRVEPVNGRYVITDLRPGHGAERCGLQLGMVVQAFNGQPLPEQLANFLPRFASSPSPAMRQYALDMLMAGTHHQPRTITVEANGQLRHFLPDTVRVPRPARVLESRLLNANTGYIKINNSLGDNELIAAFDSAVDQLARTKNLVIDLTETPSGGNTTVARGLMGRLVRQLRPYQRHEFDETGFDTRRHWAEYVGPRQAYYPGKVYVLVGRWTSSMGEGLAIGLDGMGRATVVGTPMAGLLGAIEGFTLPHSGIGYQIPTERLYHVNGTPREQFVPPVRTRNTRETLEWIKKIR